MAVSPLEFTTLCTGAVGFPVSRALLVACHRRAELDINARGGFKTKALSNLVEVKLVDVEAGAETMRGVGLEV